MPRANSLRRIGAVVGADARLASWDARRLRDEAILAALGRVLPRPIAATVRVVDLAGATLELAAPSGAMAAAIRQRTPDLCAALAGEGWNFTDLRVRVQPRNAPPPERKRLYRQIDSAEVPALQRLESGLPPGPLKAALGRWIRRRGGNG